MSNNYQFLQGFEDVYLEDSFVLGIHERNNRFIVEGEFALLEGHPHYSKPKKGEAHCYLKGAIEFGNASKVTWHKKGSHVFTDADNEIDLGNIDMFHYEIGKYLLSGDWGEVEIWSDIPRILIHL